MSHSIPFEHDEQAVAMLIGSLARNELEEFHRAHVPDAHMPELNRAIRNAAYTVLRAIHTMRATPRAEEWLRYQLRFIPSSWEQPELLEGYRASIDPKNQWFDALLRATLAPSIDSVEQIDSHGVKELAAAWAGQFAQSFPKAPAECVALEQGGHYLQTARRVKAWRNEHPDASLEGLQQAVADIYENVLAPHCRDERGMPITPAAGERPPQVA
jgi:hypothetical protein